MVSWSTFPVCVGKKWLEPGEAVYPEDLDAWEQEADIKIGRRGDIVFFRTGRWARRDAKGPWDVQTVGMPGLHASCCAWLKTAGRRDGRQRCGDGRDAVTDRGAHSPGAPVVVARDGVPHLRQL